MHDEISYKRSFIIVFKNLDLNIDVIEKGLYWKRKVSKRKTNIILNHEWRRSISWVEWHLKWVEFKSLKNIWKSSGLFPCNVWNLNGCRDGGENDKCFRRQKSQSLIPYDVFEYIVCVKFLMYVVIYCWVHIYTSKSINCLTFKVNTL